MGLDSQNNPELQMNCISDCDVQKMSVKGQQSFEQDEVER